uniref:uncharacterized protein LOC122587960 n=1 Tax=Erigeron canadensis TaxID=72917 RepID=UPI001CB97E8E|nr:uncharacterized protein LOC122587960 [Erigeron canadensis]
MGFLLNVRLQTVVFALYFRTTWMNELLFNFLAPVLFSLLIVILVEEMARFAFEPLSWRVNVADVNDTKESWTIRVKVVLRWKQTFKNYPNVVSSLDMILMDEQGTKIQASVKKNLISDFESILEEGTVRVISDFGIASNSGSYMLVNHPYKINFCKSTKVKISTDFENTVDPYIFPSFSDMLTKNLDTRVAFDVVGLVVSVDPMIVTHDAGRDKHKLTLELQDLSGNKIACALWDSYDVRLSKYISENHSADLPIVIFLHMAKLKEWNRMPQISNCLFGSRLHINDHIGPIVSFQESLKNSDVGVESSKKATEIIATTVIGKPEDYYLKFPVVTIDEIQKYIKQKKQIGLSIIETTTNIQDDVGWYYWSCRTCHKIVNRVDDEIDVDSDGHPFVCGKCGYVSEVYGKVRVIIRVQDSTGYSSFVLFEDLIEKLINRSHTWLMEKISKDQNRQIFPEELNVLLEKKFVIKIQISWFNLENGYTSYTVHRCTHDESVIEKVFIGPSSNENNKVDTLSDDVDANDVEVATPTANARKRPIDIDEQSTVFDGSSTSYAPVDNLKIPKTKHLE